MRVPKRKNPYTYPHKSRAARVNYICDVGGYSCRDGRFPVEFNVAAYDTDFSFEHIWEKYAAECWPFDESKETPEVMHAYYALARRLHKEHEGHMWDWGQEDACHNLKDDVVYSTLWDGTEVQAQLEQYGRCGKHLVISQFDGVTLKGYTNVSLGEALMLQTGGWEDTCELAKLKKGYVWAISNGYIERLYKYVRQCEVQFTPTRASEEVEYLGATCFFHNIVNSEWPSVLEDMASHDEAVEAAQAIKTALVFSTTPDIWEEFATLCTAAGITIDEVENG